MTIACLFLMAACTQKSSSEKIDSMQKRLDKAESRIEVVYNQDFQTLIGSYKALDTLLPKTAENAEIMELMAAYLQQLETYHPIMLDNISYSHQQLSDLKDDITAGVLKEEDYTLYLSQEEAALEEIEAQVRYFQDRFKEQNKIARGLMK